MGKIKVNKKNSTLILLAITVLLGLGNLILPSKEKISEVKVRKIEKEEKNLQKISGYFVENDSSQPQAYELEMKTDTDENMLKNLITDIVKKYSSSLDLINIYYGDNIIFLELSDKNISDNLLQALIMTIKERTGIDNIQML